VVQANVSSTARLSTKRSDHVVTSAFLVTIHTSASISEIPALGFAPASHDLLDFGRSATRVMTDAALKAALKSSERAQFSLNYFSGQS
jgi:hypothetical protein